MAAPGAKKGHPKWGGRNKGSENKVTKDIREAFKLLVERNLDKMEEDIAKVKPEQRLTFIINLAEYILPKLQRTIIVGDKNEPIIINMKDAQ